MPKVFTGQGNYVRSLSSQYNLEFYRLEHGSEDGVIEHFIRWHVKL